MHLDYFISNYLYAALLFKKKNDEFKNLDGSMFFTQLIKSFEKIPLPFILYNYGSIIPSEFVHVHAFY